MAKVVMSLLSKIAKSVSVLVVLGGVLCAFDYLYGVASGIAEIRREATLFRSEAATLRLATRAMVPNLEHEYPLPFRPEGETLIQGDRSRRMNTTEQGAVSTNPTPGLSGKTIAFVGGSTTECNEVDEAFRFPAIVEQRLRSDGGAVSVLNFGVRGNTTQDAINSLLNRPALAHSDLIVLMENINDRLLLVLRPDYGAVLPRSGPTSFSSVSDAAGLMLSTLWDFGVGHSNLLFFTESTLSNLNARTGLVSARISERTLDELPPPNPDAVALYAQNLRLFVGIVRLLGKTPVLMTQPLGRPSVGHEAFNETIRSVAADTRTTLVDLDQQMPLDREWAFFHDKIHFNNRGSIAVGKIIAVSLASLTDVKAP